MKRVKARMSGIRSWTPMLGLVLVLASLVVATTHHLTDPAYGWWLGLMLIGPLFAGAGLTSRSAGLAVVFPVLAGLALLTAWFGQR